MRILRTVLQIRLQNCASKCWGQSQKNFYSNGPTYDASERMVRYRADAFNVRQAGDGDHVVLCLPGLMGTTKTDFGPLFDCMDQSKFHLVCWDPPGHGKSRPPKRDHKGDYFKWDAKIIAGLMENMGFEKYSVLGWCTGGSTAHALACDFQENVTKLVTWGSLAQMDETDIEHAEKLRDRENWHLRIPDSSLAIYGHDYLKSSLNNWADSVKERVELRDWNKMYNRVNWIECPTLILHGEKDPFVKIENPQHFGKYIKDVDLHIIPEAGHDLHLTHTEEFLNFVEPFLLGEETD